MKIFEITLFGINFAPSYYGLMYSLSFLVSYIILKKKKFISEKELEIFFIYLFLGVIIGGRLGYVIFYNLSYYINNIGELFAFWKGGMSFHGGVIGVIISTILFCKKNNLIFLKIIDKIIVVIPICLGLGRIGNYINKELLGGEYYGFLCVQVHEKCYFPTPLLEMIFEGLILYLILQYLSTKVKNYGNLSGAFLFFYGIFRFFMEFLRIPDIQVGYIFDIITMGQILSIPMIISGIYFWLFYNKYPINTK